MSVKILAPTRRKQAWLDATAERFAQAVSFGLAQARSTQAANRARLHSAVYPEARRLGLQSDYARMAMNETTSLMRTFFGLRRKGRKASFPVVHAANRIGLGVMRTPSSNTTDDSYSGAPPMCADSTSGGVDKARSDHLF